MTTDDLTARLRHAAQQALACQDACNLSGVLFSYARHMQTLCDLGLDGPQRATHPVTTLFLDKLVQLAGGFVDWHDECNARYGQALRDAEALAAVLGKPDADRPG
jgi:hypothetical protein